MSALGSILRGIRDIFGQDAMTTYAFKAAGMNTETFAEDGGPGSGNFGHAGRPGKRGGSGKGGGKGSGTMMRTGSKESGYSSFAKTPEFTKMTNLVRKYHRDDAHPNKNGFWAAVNKDPELHKALSEQHKRVSPNESLGDYCDRMYDMISRRVGTERTKVDLDKIGRSLTDPSEKQAWKAATASGMPDAAIRDDVNEAPLVSQKRKLIDIVGNHADWSSRLVDRNFKNLTDSEQDALNEILDRHPWSNDERQSKIPNEEAIYSEESDSVAAYYVALKAKALGVRGIYVPEKPDFGKRDYGIGSIREKLSPDETKWMDGILGKERSAGEVISETGTITRRRMLDILASHSDWDKQFKDRKFDNLNEQESAALTYLLDKYPWDGKEAEPTEKSLYESGLPRDIQKYYDCLKAKAIGVEGVDVPNIPLELDYAMKHEPANQPVDWKSKLSPENREMVDRYLEGQASVNDFFRNANAFRRRKLLDAVAKTTDWNDKLKNRQFDRLSEAEKKDMDFILDQYPYFGDPANLEKYGPDEESLYSGLESRVKKYYDQLKAKALGLKVSASERPKALEYAMTHKSFDQVIQSQNGSYQHTEAGDKFRASVKERFESDGSAGDRKLFNGVTEELEPHRAKIIESIDNMDDRMAELVAKTMDRADVRWNTEQTTQTSFYNATGQIMINTRKADGSLRTPEDIAETFWHEYGHFIDDENDSKTGTRFYDDPLGTGIDYPSGSGVTDAVVKKRLYDQAARKDIQNLLDAAGLSEKYKLLDEINEYGGKLTLVRISDGKRIEPHVYDPDLSEAKFEITEGIDQALKNYLGYDDVINFMQKHGAPEEVEYGDYFETYTTPKRKITRTREKFKGAEEAYRQARMEFDRKWDAWVESIGGQDAYFELAHQKEAEWKKYEARQNKMGRVTDCIDEAVNGLFSLMVTWGAHDAPYYRAKGKPIETTANIFSIRATNDPEVVDFMNKTMPNIAELFTKTWRADYD